MPSRRRRLGRRLRNPLVVVPLVVAVLTAGWLQYASGANSVSQARAGADLFSVAQAVGDHTVDGWRVGHSNDATASLQPVDGHVTDRALQVEVTRYVSGDVTLTSPRVPVSPRQQYLFKAYRSSETSFTLLTRRFHRDGTVELVQLQDYPARQGAWSTVGDAFDSGDTTVAVQYVFRLAAKGTLQVDGAYLEPARDVHVATAPPAAPNLLPNPDLAGAQPNAPDQWASYHSGRSTVDFGGARDGNGRYLWTRIRDYRSGEAKWQYPPVPVGPHRYYQFRATYQADRPVDVVAEFEQAGGGRAFTNLSTVSPAGDWTTVTADFQAPESATAVMVTLVSHGNGATAVRDHDLVDVSKPGPTRWARPLVSLTFDDGWQSAYDQARPLLAERGFAATFYVNPATIETPRFMTAAELQVLHRAGHEIANHGYEDVDLTALSAGRIDSELRKGRDELAEAGLATDDLAAPLGRTDAQVQWYARQYFQTVRGMDAGINTRQNLDPFDLRVFYVDDQTTPAELEQQLTEAKRSHGWLILVYHQISVGGSINSDHSTITRNAFAAQLDVIRHSGISVEPVSRAFSETQGS